MKSPDRLTESYVMLTLSCQTDCQGVRVRTGLQVLTNPACLIVSLIELYCSLSELHDMSQPDAGEDAHTNLPITEDGAVISRQHAFHDLMSRCSICRFLTDIVKHAVILRAGQAEGHRVYGRLACFRMIIHGRGTLDDAVWERTWE